jgi:hypothetical protein
VISGALGGDGGTNVSNERGSVEAPSPAPLIAATFTTKCLPLLKDSNVDNAEPLKTSKNSAVKLVDKYTTYIETGEP